MMDKPANRFYGEQKVEIKPGHYGSVLFYGFRNGYAHIDNHTLLTANELREAAHLFNQLAEALERE